MADAPKFNLRNPAVKRIMQEIKELKQDTSGDILAEALESDIFEWHFIIRGPRDTEFEGGVYHGRILLPAEYPFKPPAFMMLTPNGRWETNVKICLSISSHHPEHWQPSWSVRTALTALIAFMPSPGAGALGALDFPKEERRVLAARSRGEAPRFGSAERQRVIDDMHARMLAIMAAEAAGSGGAAGAAGGQQGGKEQGQQQEQEQEEQAAGSPAAADAATAASQPPAASSSAAPEAAAATRTSTDSASSTQPAAAPSSPTPSPPAPCSTTPTTTPSKPTVTATAAVSPAPAPAAVSPPRRATASAAAVPAAAPAAAVVVTPTDHVLTALMWALYVGIGAILLRKVMGAMGVDLGELMEQLQLQ